MGEAGTTRRRGRPRADSKVDTRARIVEAATAEFAEHGYEASSVRAIARRAGVDPALVRHYFEDKPALVAAVVQVPVRPELIVREALDGPADELGMRLVTAVLTAWDAPAVRPAAVAVLRSATGQGPVSRMLHEFLRRELLHRIAEQLDGGDAELRAELAASQVVGMLLVRYVLRFEPMASMPRAQLAALVAPAVQLYLTGPMPAASDDPAATP